MNSLSKSTRNRFIDVLKGVCMILIILTHVPWEDGEYNRFLFAFWRDMAVPILMIISGYVYSLSFSRKGISTLSDAYEPRSWLPALVRYTLPFTIFYVAELILIIFIRKTPTTLLACLKMFLHGGHGAGSYYYPVLVQFIFLFPVLYFIVQKYKRNGFFLCLGLNAIFELLQWGYNMDGEFYRLMIFRYITVIAYGCYLATADYKPSKPLCFASLGAGALFITLVYYFS